jgi:hypothetical protein
LILKIPHLLHGAPQLLSHVDSAPDTAIRGRRMTEGLGHGGVEAFRNRFMSGAKLMNGDFCNTDGARKLKAKIEEYWAERGFDVSINLVDAGFVPAMRSARTDVRSNMVNGMPPRKKSDQRAQPGKSSTYLRGVG